MEIEHNSCNNINQLEHVWFELTYHEYVVSLIDASGYEIVRGFGNSKIEVINDLHCSLL